MIISTMSCQKTFENGTTKANTAASGWWVTLTQDGNDVLGLGTFFLNTYNTSANDDSIWVDDLQNSWQFKCKAAINYQNLTFSATNKGGLFGTVLSTTLPPSAQDWAYLTHFDMTLQRTYTYRGKQRSYVSAACRAPAGFPGAVFPFAKARYGFDDGREMRTTVVRSCKVAG